MGIREDKFNIQTYNAMKPTTFLFVFLMAVSLSSGCSGNSDIGSQANTQIAASNSVAPPNTVQTNPGTSEAPASGRPVLQFVPAPEDSQIAQASQNGKMYEVRIWKKHPKLLKVESISIDEKNKALTMILRSAQVVNITTDRISNVKLATADQFLELAASASATGSPVSKTESKKAE